MSTIPEPTLHAPTEMERSCVLVVDDNEQNRQLCTANLTDENFEVLEAPDGQEAIRLARQQQPDVILMDIMMPVMDGLEATRLLKSESITEHIPIILLTARSGSTDVVEGLASGANEYVAKPINVCELIARVQAMSKLSKALSRAEQLTKHLADLVDEQTDRLQLLYDFAKKLSSKDTLEGALESAVHAAAQVTKSERVSIMLPDETGKELYVAHAMGIDPEVAKQAYVAVGMRVSGRVYQENTTLVNDEKHKPVEPEYEYGSENFVSIPIISTSIVSNNEPVGVLNVTNRANGEPYTPEEINCLRSIGDTVAVAIQNHLRRRELDKARDAAIFALASLAERRDSVTGEHLERVQQYAQVLGEQLATSGPYVDDVTEEYLEDLCRSLPLHDIGKVAIPDAILLKPGKLTAEEFEIMKKHTTIGAETLERVVGTVHTQSFLRMGLDITRYHHEKFDGAGYPEGLVGLDIPLCARIAALVDVYDALTTDRPYKSAMPHQEAVEIIHEGRGTHFDPAVVDAFDQVQARFDEVRRALPN